MRAFTQNEPLTDTELDRLGDFLKSCKSGRAMNVETLDGFFAALIAGPETVMPSEYYSEVFGGEMSDACEFGSLDEANEILGLMMRHWNTIAGTLFKGEVYVPLLVEDENGTAHGNDWAPRFNIAPTQRVPVIRQNPKEPVRELSLVRWGTHSIMGERLVRRRQDDQRKIGNSGLGSTTWLTTTKNAPRPWELAQTQEGLFS